VRKCINCGAGVYVKLLPPKYQAIPPERWELMQEHFEEQMAELDARREAIYAQREHEQWHQAAAADPAFAGFTDSVLERINDLWSTGTNPLWREDGELTDREHALIREVTRRSSLSFVMEAMDRGAEPDEEIVAREQALLLLVAAGGYLWRHAERDVLQYDAPLAQAEFAIDFMKEHPNAADTEPFELIARAVMWTLESLTTLSLPSECGMEHGDASLDVGYESIVPWCCDREGLDRGALTIDEDGLRDAFTTGVALREVERYFPA
jgi:hypothetical protein